MLAEWGLVAITQGAGMVEEQDGHQIQPMLHIMHVEVAEQLILE
jgi:hypothetical protein